MKKEFYALAIEENGTYGLLDGNVTEKGNHFTTIKQAREARSREDCGEALEIVHIRVVEQYSRSKKKYGSF